MQNRYTGDIGDYVKYGLLRALTEDRRLGVAWYLFPDEPARTGASGAANVSRPPFTATRPPHTGDGRHIEYLQSPDCWRSRDPDLFDTLKRIVKEGRRCVAAVEDSGILMEAKFSNEILSARDSSPGKYRQRCDWRSRWFERVQDALRDCDVVFADPDNGLCEDDKFRPGTMKCWKRLPLHEAKMLAEGRTAIIYHHNTRFPGGNRKEIEYWMKRLGSETLALYWRAWSNRTFFIVNSAPDMKERLKQFVQEWGPEAELISNTGMNYEPEIRSSIERQPSFTVEEMTLSQMKSRFRSEWILIGDPDTDRALNVRSGKVLHHSKDRDEVYRKAISLRPMRSAVMYTGRIPEDTAIIL